MKPVPLNVVRSWPPGFEERLAHTWGDVQGKTPSARLYDIQQVLAEFGFTLTLQEGRPNPAETLARRFFEDRWNEAALRETPDQAVPAEYMAWLQTQAPRTGFGGNMVWNAAVAWARQHAIDWAVSRWREEVAARPLQNVHRRTLDGTWRQVLRWFGVDDVQRLGDRHDDLLASGRPAAAMPVVPVPASMDDNYRQWYHEAMRASNAAGFVGFSAAQTIEVMDQTATEQREALKRVIAALEGSVADGGTGISDVAGFRRALMALGEIAE